MWMNIIPLKIPPWPLGEAFIWPWEIKAEWKDMDLPCPWMIAMAQVLIDFGGRPWLVWDAEFQPRKNRGNAY